MRGGPDWDPYILLPCGDTVCCGCKDAVFLAGEASGTNCSFCPTCNKALTGCEPNVFLLDSLAGNDHTRGDHVAPCRSEDHDASDADGVDVGAEHVVVFAHVTAERVAVARAEVARTTAAVKSTSASLQEAAVRAAAAVETGFATAVSALEASRSKALWAVSESLAERLKLLETQQDTLTVMDSQWGAVEGALQRGGKDAHVWKKRIVEWGLLNHAGAEPCASDVLEVVVKAPPRPVRGEPALFQVVHSAAEQEAVHTYPLRSAIEQHKNRIVASVAVLKVKRDEFGRLSRAQAGTGLGFVQNGPAARAHQIPKQLVDEIARLEEAVTTGWNEFIDEFAESPHRGSPLVVVTLLRAVSSVCEFGATGKEDDSRMFDTVVDTVREVSDRTAEVCAEWCRCVNMLLEGRFVLMVTKPAMAHAMDTLLECVVKEHRTSSALPLQEACKLLRTIQVPTPTMFACVEMATEFPPPCHALHLEILSLIQHWLMNTGDITLCKRFAPFVRGVVDMGTASIQTAPVEAPTFWVLRMAMQTLAKLEDRGVPHSPSALPHLLHILRILALVGARPGWGDACVEVSITASNRVCASIAIDEYAAATAVEALPTILQHATEGPVVSVLVDVATALLKLPNDSPIRPRALAAMQTLAVVRHVCDTVTRTSSLCDTFLSLLLGDDFPALKRAVNSVRDPSVKARLRAHFSIWN